MLRFRQKKIVTVFVLLSLSLNSFADTGLKEKKSTNLVELFKVKTHATDHIKGLEAKLLRTNEADQEELLVELAQSLLYYQDRHNKVSDSKAGISKGVSSLSANGSSGKASKLGSDKGQYSTTKIYRKALNAYKKASKLSLNKSRIKYTRELSELAVKLQKKDELVQVFDELLQHGGDESGTYLAHVDYADGLAKFKDDGAETQFLTAISLRNPADGVEAYFRYANYLLDKNTPREALSLLDKFTPEERRIYVHIARLRQKLMHTLNIDTNEVDTEIKGLRKNLINSDLIRAIPKFVDKNITGKTVINTLALATAYAFVFSHNNESDDTRGQYRHDWVKSPLGPSFTTWLVNAAEVIYNEGRGHNVKQRYAIAWAIRNRATLDMNGCDSYPGSESSPLVSTCRIALANSSTLHRIYSCVVHGGTTRVGASHVQMNDSHVEIVDLASSGILWEMVNVMSGWVPDPTSSNSFIPATYPSENHFTGNPKGAQEWSRNNYCAENYHCKVRLGNVGSQVKDLRDICPFSGYDSTTNYFWGRQPSLVDLTITVE